MNIRDLADLAIDDDLGAPCLYIPSERWDEFLQAVDRKPNLIGVVIYRGKTVHDGGPGTDIATGSDQGGKWRR